MANICNPTAMNAWEPSNEYRSFVVKENVVSKFEQINNDVKNICQSIDKITTALKEIKRKMGENCGSINEIDNIILNINSKKEDLITKNSELINACDQCILYVYQNKADKQAEAEEVQRQLSKISVYEG